MRASDPVSQNLEPGKKKGKGIFIFLCERQNFMLVAGTVYEGGGRRGDPPSGGLN